MPKWEGAKAKTASGRKYVAQHDAAASSSLPHKTATACKEAQSHSTQKAHQENGVNCTAVSRLKESPKTGNKDKNIDDQIGKRPRRKGAKRDQLALVQAAPPAWQERGRISIQLRKKSEGELSH